MMNVSISIAMATYNGGHFIQEQLDSLARQIVKPFELIVCDDGSTDDTVGIVKDFAGSSAFPVRIFTNDKNLGYSDNFLKAASLCRGGWISYCDQDDFWFPNKLEKISKIIAQKSDEELLLIAHSADRTTKNLEPIGRRTPDFKRSKIIRKNRHYGFWVYPGFTCTFRRRLISEYDWTKRPGDFNGGDKQAHDIWICMMANALGNTYVMKESLAYWRRHPNATTVSISNCEIPTLREKIKNSQKFGSDLYRYRSMVAKQSSETMKLLAQEHAGEKDIYNNLIKGSDNFEKLYDCLTLREKLYSDTGLSGQMNSMLEMFIVGAYFGNKFYAFGLRSLLKDLHHVAVSRMSTG